MRIRGIITFMENRGLINPLFPENYDEFLICLRCRSYVVISSGETMDKIYEIYDNEEDAQERVDILRMLNIETKIVMSSFKRTELPVSFDEFRAMTRPRHSLLELSPECIISGSGKVLHISAWNLIKGRRSL